MGRLKGWEKTYHADINQKEAEMSMLISKFTSEYRELSDTKRNNVYIMIK